MKIIIMLGKKQTKGKINEALGTNLLDVLRNKKSWTKGGIEDKKEETKHYCV
jgi:hypothetical protein